MEKARPDNDITKNFIWVHLTERLNGLEKLIDEKFKSRDKSIEENFGSRDKAVKKQGKEYQRRLAELNNEEGRLKEQLQNSVSPDKFDGGMNQVNQRINEQGKLIQLLNDWKTGQGGGTDKILDIREWIRWLIIVAGFVAMWYFK